MARAALYCLALTKVEPLKSVFRRDDYGNLIGAELGRKLPKTLDKAKKYISRNTAIQYYPVGIYAILLKNKGGVVDSKLRVYRISNVRVINASIFLTYVQGNIISLVYILAEKGADIVKKAR
jgi:choline dehydrogenase